MKIVAQRALAERIGGDSRDVNYYRESGVFPAIKLSPSRFVYDLDGIFGSSPDYEGADEFDALLAKEYFDDSPKLATVLPDPPPAIPSLAQNHSHSTTVRRVQFATETSDLIETAQLMKWLQISRRTAQNWRDQGKIPFIRASRRRFFYNKEQVLRALGAEQ